MRYETKLTALRLLPAPARRMIMTRRYRRDMLRGERELRQLSRLVGPSDLAIDIGCNYGVYAYALSRLAKRVIAFEPNPDLARFVAGLQLPGVEVRQIALSSSSGEADFIIPAGLHQQGSLRPQAGEGGGSGGARFTVKTATLDSFDLRGVGFIKIDVEGFEEHTLAGAMGTIARERPHVLVEIEERHNPGGLERIRRSFATLGYRCLFLDRGEWRSAELFSAEIHQRAGAPDADQAAPYINNFLFAPPGSTSVAAD